MGSLNLNLKETELCLGLPGGNGEMEITGKGSKRAFSATVDLKLNLADSCTDGQDLMLNTNNNNNDTVASLKNMNPSNDNTTLKDPAKPPAKAQVVGWPPVRSYRKNLMAQKVNSEEGKKGSNNIINGENQKGNMQNSPSSSSPTSPLSSSSSLAAAFVKVSMDGAPYLRKVDLKMYTSYQQLSDALAKMFSSFTMGNYGPQGMIDFMNERKLMDVLNSSEYVPTYEDKDGDWMLVGDVPWQMFVESCKRLRIMKGSEAIGLAPRAMEKCKSRS